MRQWGYRVRTDIDEDVGTMRQSISLSVAAAAAGYVDTRGASWKRLDFIVLNPSPSCSKKLQLSGFSSAIAVEACDPKREASPALDCIPGNKRGILWRQPHGPKVLERERGARRKQGKERRKEGNEETTSADDAKANDVAFA